MTMNIFETEAQRYDLWFEKHPHIYKSEVAAIRTALPIPHNCCLEIGIGTGRFATPFGIIDGVEPAVAMRSIAESRGIDAIDGTAEKLPYDNESFNCALMVTTICFVDDPTQSCKEAWRILKPGGTFVVGFVDRKSFLGKIYESQKEKSLFYRNAHFFSAQEVAGLMTTAGFSDLQFRQTLFHLPENTKSTEPVMSGHGEGGFVVISGRKP